MLVRVNKSTLDDYGASDIKEKGWFLAIEPIKMSSPTCVNKSGEMK